MQSFNVVLSSIQTTPAYPAFLDHYLFLDPAYGLNFTYPNTAYGGLFYVPTSASNPQNLWFASYNPACCFGGLTAYDLINSQPFILSGVGLGKMLSFYNTTSAREYVFSVYKNSVYTDFSTNNDFTVAAVFSASNFSSSSFKRIVSKGHWSLEPGYLIQIDDSGKVLTGIGSLSGFVPGASALYVQTISSCLNNNWFNHVAVTVNRTTNILNLYVNGVKQYLRPALNQNVSFLFNASGYDIDFTTAAPILCASSNNSLFLGGAYEDINNPNAGEFYSGYITDVKIFNNALSQPEVEQDLNSYFWFTSSSYVYALTTSGGVIFPYGYQKQNVTHYLDLSAFKGPITLTYIPSAIDNTYFPTLKILYNFGDNTTAEVDKTAIGNASFYKNNLNVVTGPNPVLPNNYYVSHDYWPQNNDITSFAPSISVITGDSVYNIFNINFSLVPDSIYSLGDFRLLNRNDLNSAGNKAFVVAETEYNDFYLNN